MTQTRFISEFRAAPARAGEQASARVKQMVVYSGAPVYRFDWWSGEEYMLTLSTDPEHVNLKRMRNAPVLADHYRSVDRTVGVVEDVWLDGKKLMAETRFAETEDVADVWAKVESGIIRNVSVEAAVLQTKDTSKKGDKMRSLLAIDWEPQAVALVPVGADPGAQLLSGDAGSAIWLPEELYRKPQGFDLTASAEAVAEEFAETGAASDAKAASNHQLLALLMRRRRAA